jgi:hypothetical protein
LKETKKKLSMPETLTAKIYIYNMTFSSFLMKHFRIVENRPFEDIFTKSDQDANVE